MKTSNKILLTALIVVSVAILAALVIARTSLYSAMTEGDGNIVAMERDVESFEKIRISGNYKVTYSIKGTHSLLVTTDDNLQEFIITEVRNNELLIRSARPLRSRSDLNIEVGSPRLTHVNANGSAEFTTRSPLEADEFHIVASAGSNVSVKGFFRTLSAEQNAGSRIFLNGTTNFLSISSNEGGSVDASDMEADNASVVANAGASATVNARELTATANAGGSINYIGDPIFQGITSNAGGTVRRINRN